MRSVKAARKKRAMAKSTAVPAITGRLTGTIRYSQLELERGGQIAGNISVINAEAGSSANPSRTADRRPAPMFGETGGAEEKAQSA